MKERAAQAGRTVDHTPTEVRT